MSLIDFIKKIQEKPRYVRIQILWLSVFISMLIVGSLWFFSFKYSMRNISTNQEAEKIKELTETVKDVGKEIPSLKEALKASIGSFFKDTVKIEENKEVNNIQVLKEVRPAKLPLSN